MKNSFKNVSRTPSGQIKRDMFYSMTDAETDEVKAYMAKNELSVAALFRKLCRDHLVGKTGIKGKTKKK